jgi:hypothetical protein
MTELIAALSAIIVTLGTALGILLKRMKNNVKGGYADYESTPLRRDFANQVKLCNERFITLASDIGSIKSSVTSIEKAASDGQRRIEDKLDDALRKK